MVARAEAAARAGSRAGSRAYAVEGPGLGKESAPAREAGEQLCSGGGIGNGGGDGGDSAGSGAVRGVHAHVRAGSGRAAGVAAHRNCVTIVRNNGVGDTSERGI